MTRAEYVRGLNRGIDAIRECLRTRARPCLLTILAFLLSTQATVSGLAEYAQLRASLRPGNGDGLIRSVPRTYRASLFPGRDIFENRTEQQRGALRYASLEVTGALPKGTFGDVRGLSDGVAEPPVRRAKPHGYPNVYRANKGDRRVLDDGKRTVKRMDPRTGRLVRLTLTAREAAELALHENPAGPTTTPSEIPLPPKVGTLAQGGKQTGEPEARKTVTLVKQRSRELMCLAKAVYFEARGESEVGQLAVAQVVLNRVALPFYPNNICDVVFQNEARRNKCQFSFACDGRSDRPHQQAAWAEAIMLAKKAMHGKRIKSVGEATHYHATYVSPHWVGEMVKQKRIGKHIFYRVRAWS